MSKTVPWPCQSSNVIKLINYYIRGSDSTEIDLIYYLVLEIEYIILDLRLNVEIELKSIAKAKSHPPSQLQFNKSRTHRTKKNA